LSIAKDIELNVAKEFVLETINSGKAYNKFLEFVSNQGGNIKLLKYSNNIIEVRSNKEGYITNIDALIVGNIVNKMANKEGHDYSVGVELLRHVGSYVNLNEVIAKVYANELYSNNLIDAFTIEKDKKEQRILEFIIKF
jgi:pyrimidine-nucleoside phosphorylase